MDPEIAALARQDFSEVKPGDELVRIWGDDFMRSSVRVSAVDDDFIYCDAQRKSADESWFVLPSEADRWKFDKTFGVETDEEFGWGVPPYGYMILSRVVAPSTE